MEITKLCFNEIMSHRNNQIEFWINEQLKSIGLVVPENQVCKQSFIKLLRSFDICIEDHSYEIFQAKFVLKCGDKIIGFPLNYRIKVTHV